MTDPTPLYRLDDTATTDSASVLVVQLDGFIDAGAAGRLLGEALLTDHEHEVVATFDIDALYDYRGRRPVVIFDKDRWTSYDRPLLQLHRVEALDGTPFLLLRGTEPDFRWEAMVAAVASLADRFGVHLTVSVHGIPMAVPHTRPIGSIVHGTNPALVGSSEAVFGQVQVPGGLANLIELRFGEQGRDAVGVAVQVPHYLAQSAFHQAALAGLAQLRAVTGLDLQTRALTEAAHHGLTQIAGEVAGNEEATALVTALEHQYDTAARGAQMPSLLADAADVPSAEELGAEFEAFLKDVAADPTEGGAES